MAIESIHRTGQIALSPERIPAEMTGVRQWVGWKYELRGGNLTKVLWQVSKYARADSTDPKTWGSFPEALEAMRRYGYDGIGFVLADGWVGVDIDKCRDPDTTIIAPWAIELLIHFAHGAYIEVSPSGTGIKVFGRGASPGSRHKTPYHAGAVEIYDENRFFTVTGAALVPGPIGDISAGVEAAYQQVFPPKPDPPPLRALPTPIQEDDGQVIQRVKRSRNGATFEALYSGDMNGYAGESEARAALIYLLIFHTQRDAAQIERLIRTSGRDSSKFDTRRGAETFLEYEIRRALEDYDGPVYDPGRRAALPDSDPQAEIAALRAELAKCHEVIEVQRAALADRDEQIAAFKSDIGSYADVLLEVAKEVDARIRKGMTEQDGSVHVPFGIVAARCAGRNAPPEVRESVKSRTTRALAKAVERNLLSKVTVTKLSSVDEDTGEILDEPKRTRMTYIKWGPDYQTMRFSLANCQRPEDAPKHGGARIRCDEHPEAKVITTKTYHCSVCSKTLRPTVPDTDGEEEEQPETRTQTDTANLHYIPIHGVGNSDTASLHLQYRRPNPLCDGCQNPDVCGPLGYCPFADNLKPQAPRPATNHNQPGGGPNG